MQHYPDFHFVDTAEKLEEWRACSFDKNYEVSNLGRVRRCRPGKGTHVGKILKPYYSRGYPQVQLSNGGKSKKQKVHKLVARAFLGKRPKNLAINHKDGVPANSSVGNLEYISLAENQQHAISLGLRKVGLNIYQFRVIKRCKAFRRIGLIPFLAKCWGLSRVTLWRVVGGHTSYGQQFLKMTSIS